jgi:hypothetical protein
VVLTADSILARSTRRRQTSTGWNTAYIGANRYTLPPDEKPPAYDALHPMAFLIEKGPGAVTRPHFHQADQFQVVVAGRGMLGNHEFSDGAVHYTDAYSAYGPIVAGKSGTGTALHAPKRKLATRNMTVRPSHSSMMHFYSGPPMHLLSGVDSAYFVPSVSARRRSAPSKLLAS